MNRFLSQSSKKFITGKVFNSLNKKTHYVTLITNNKKLHFYKLNDVYKFLNNDRKLSEYMCDVQIPNNAKVFSGVLHNETNMMITGSPYKIPHFIMDKYLTNCTRSI